jgi:hypothetical protein
LRTGLPHSEIPGSTIARISPGLFAACHVLHRLSVPRHPPDALVMTLDLKEQDPPRTGTSPGERRACSREDTSTSEAENGGRTTDDDAAGAKPPRPRLGHLHFSLHAVKEQAVCRNSPAPGKVGRSRVSTALAAQARLPRGHRGFASGPWWRRSGSNRRPPACKAGALPTELRPPEEAVSSQPLALSRQLSAVSSQPSALSR